jgi:hypothetical protein
MLLAMRRAKPQPSASSECKQTQQAEAGGKEREPGRQRSGQSANADVIETDIGENFYGREEQCGGARA